MFTCNCFDGTVLIEIRCFPSENILLVNNATGTKLESTEEETNPSKLFVEIGTSFVLLSLLSEYL